MSGNNPVILKKLWIVALGMFAFGFALVPFYEKICEVTGVNADDAQILAKNTQVDLSRKLTLELDANVDSKLPWKFSPAQNSIQLHPGEMVQVMYDVENLSDQDIVGQAIPSYAPLLTAQFVKKIECFCFTAQTLKAHEKRKMPVMLVLDPNLPKDMNTVTLSYTFFVKPGASSLSGLKNRSENSAGRGQILTFSQGNSRSIAQGSGEIWTGQADLQPISFKSDRLLESRL